MEFNFKIFSLILIKKNSLDFDFSFFISTKNFNSSVFFFYVSAAKKMESVRDVCDVPLFMCCAKPTTTNTKLNEIYFVQMPFDKHEHAKTTFMHTNTNVLRYSCAMFYMYMFSYLGVWMLWLFRFSGVRCKIETSSNYCIEIRKIPTKRHLKNRMLQFAAEIN